MTTQIRMMQLDDVDSVYAIELTAHIAPWSRQILHDCVAVGYDCRVLEIDKKVLGYIISRYDETSCHILNLCIAPASQGKGYGQLLLQQMLDSLTNTPITNVILEVRPSNAIALCLYHKMGFERIGLKVDYYTESEPIEDAVVLEKLIIP